MESKISNERCPDCFVSHGDFHCPPCDTDLIFSAYTPEERYKELHGETSTTLKQPDLSEPPPVLRIILAVLTAMVILATPIFWGSVKSAVLWLFSVFN